MESIIKFLRACVLICCLLALLGCVYGYILTGSIGFTYETTSISDYGNIVGNIVNRDPREFIFSFFPEKIDERFQNVTYHYKAMKLDTYAYECYLEFTLSNSDEWHTFLDEYLDRTQNNVFPYDDSFYVHSVSNVLNLQLDCDTGIYPIGFAEIGLILYREEDYRVVFVAIGTYDGGGADTSELSYFFDRFDIDVIDYQMNAFSGRRDQELGITYKERSLEFPAAYPCPR